MADGAVVMAKATKHKAEMEEVRISLMKEREQNRVNFTQLEGLDELSVRIIRLKKQKILEEIEQTQQLVPDGDREASQDADNENKPTDINASTAGTASSFG
ncbi:hypothetical protein PHYPSEUDO_012546 [Phytophthora pseudosyringae]|uniref:Uncharacterized protein n=1 Tax=Phytophthora pseudosyringae TaxID=221518 RepID=A0A8T1V7J8_9STRA|nr:hypothetical protein PHYPSEUDO_012546 [Phytophthora pseudosyringae]